MFLEKTEYGAVDVVRFPHRLTMGDAAMHRHALRDLVDSGRIHLVLDMSAVQSVDSSGLSVLVSAAQAARKADGDVVLLGLSGAVRSLIELTRLHHVFDIFTELNAAIDYFSEAEAA
jgi:anti-sigma B factor antagonist